MKLIGTYNNNKYFLICGRFSRKVAKKVIQKMKAVICKTIEVVKKAKNYMIIDKQICLKISTICKEMIV